MLTLLEPPLAQRWARPLSHFFTPLRAAIAAFECLPPHAGTLRAGSPVCGRPCPDRKLSANRGRTRARACAMTKSAVPPAKFDLANVSARAVNLFDQYRAFRAVASIARRNVAHRWMRTVVGAGSKSSCSIVPCLSGAHLIRQEGGPVVIESRSALVFSVGVPALCPTGAAFQRHSRVFPGAEGV